MNGLTTEHPSTRRTTVFADIDGFGRVYDCGDCGGVHVAVGPVSLTFSPSGSRQFVALVEESAVNFELHRAHAGSPGAMPIARGVQ